MSGSHYKPIICIDFDGVIHTYSRGWQGGVIYDPVTEGFFEWMEKTAEHFELTVYSSRSKNTDQQLAMMQWLEREYSHWQIKNNRQELVVTPLKFAHEKPPALITIDDRALTFNGNWEDFSLEALRSFKPWNAK